MRKKVSTFLFLLVYLLGCSVVSYASGDVDSSISLLYNGVYQEKQLYYGEDLTVEAQVKNNSQETKNVALYVALYDTSNRLKQLVSDSLTLAVGADSELMSVVLSWPQNLPSDQDYFVKSFVWDKQSLEPYSDIEFIDKNKSDYYANTFAQAKQLDLEKEIQGCINTSTDVDIIKIVPSETADYIIQSTSSIMTDGALYNGSQTKLSDAERVNAQDNGFYIKQNLSAGQTYYIKVTGKNNSAGDYTVNIRKMSSNSLVIITQNQMAVSGTVPATSQLTAKMYDINNTLMAQSTVTPINFNYNASINVTPANAKYKIIVAADNKIYAIFKVSVLTNTAAYPASIGTYISVPVMVSNADQLGNIGFSVCYDNAKLDLADVCENTVTAELGTGLVSTAEVNIQSVSSGSVAFKSVKSITSPWAGIVNTVKLKAKTAEAHSVKTYAYKVQ